jgi:plastocyanin
MRRRIRRWWRAAVAAAAILSPQAATADQPVHDIQVAATQCAFERATMQVTAGESMRLVNRSQDVVHGPHAWRSTGRPLCTRSRI